MKILSFIILSIVVIVIGVGCTNPTITPVHVSEETPTPSPILQQLPQYGRIDCSYSRPVDGMTAYYLFEFPGLSPKGCDSACMSVLGAKKGSAPRCSVALITDYAWSEWDNVYYYYVKYQEPIPVTRCKGGSDGDICTVAVEFQQSEGWIKANNVEMPYLEAAPTPNIPYPIRTPVSMPSIPESYGNLPQYGRIRCNLDPLHIDDPQFFDQHRTSTVVLWETPNPTVEEGKFGEGYPTISKPVNWSKRVAFCDVIRVTDFAWSAWDGTFYFYAEDLEYGYGGWIKQEYVEFPYLGPTPMFFPTYTPIP